MYWFCLSQFSRLAGVMFLPPAVMMMSFLRPVMWTTPSSSIRPMSPVCSQLSTIVSYVASSFL
jgi:hypothetical protein